MMESINTLIPFAAQLFGAILTIGATYIVAMIFLGGIVDAGIDADVDVDIDFDSGVGGSADTGGEAVGISLNVIAAFCVGVGAMGLVAALNDWSIILTILSSLLFGAFLGRFFQSTMNLVLRQQGGDVITANSLIGTAARVTVDTPAGKYGEALIEEPERIKYPVKHVDGEALEKGETVIIVNVEEGRLHVKKEFE